MRLFQNKQEVLKQIQVYKDRLLIYKDQVIDISDFKHPGPQELIDNNIGKDIQKLFEEQNHSKNAYLLLKKYQIGKIMSDEQEYVKNDLINEKEEQIHKILDKKINPKKPLEDQVKKLTREEFLVYISRPRYAESETSIQIHSSKIIDILNQANIWMNLVIYTLLSMYLINKTYKEAESIKDKCKWWMTLILSMILFWSLTEYVMHRFVLHGEDRLPENPTGEQIFTIFKRHTQHHVYMNQKYRVAQKIIISLPMFTALYSILYLLIGNYYTQVFIAGIFIGQQSYDQLHYYFHFGSEPYFNFLKKLKANHMKHHWRDRKKGFGVTNLHWDYTMGTLHK